MYKKIHLKCLWKMRTTDRLSTDEIGKKHKYTPITKKRRKKWCRLKSMLWKSAYFKTRNWRANVSRNDFNLFLFLFRLPYSCFDHNMCDNFFFLCRWPCVHQLTVCNSMSNAGIFTESNIDMILFWMLKKINKWLFMLRWEQHLNYLCFPHSNTMKNQ